MIANLPLEIVLGYRLHKRLRQLFFHRYVLEALADHLPHNCVQGIGPEIPGVGVPIDSASGVEGPQDLRGVRGGRADAADAWQAPGFRCRGKRRFSTLREMVKCYTFEDRFLTEEQGSTVTYRGKLQFDFLR